ncbi:site-specific integrase [Acidocella sp. KAb 2-4]|uniref:tyrosine-type recombinase/integrase n=1 Tax=Acidocella sp. KAb 2-4 TaxID=2885158 RepID=UPI001D06B4C6|nr:site-specific integrase [Acidocella sp. KAb 2-4]MCB5945387.1 tyrosine-type recombinase/integrase [Acidocella sp. KAb 2-4]
MAKAITETAISAAVKQAASTGQRVELIDATQPGLRLRVTKAGAKAWTLTARDPHGRMRRFTLGIHPTLSISAAREAARVTWAQVRGGADPVQEARHKRAVAKAAKEGIGTLNALLDLYARKDGAALKSWPECRKRIESVFKPYLKKPLDTLKAKDLQLQADSWKSAQSAAAAVRYIRPLLKWAAATGRGYVSRELADLVPPATVGRRERVLSPDELSRLLPALRDSQSPYAACMRLMLLTLARRSEATGAHWRDINLEAGTWTIPQTKNGKPHIVPLSTQAKALLEAVKPARARPEALIFPTRDGNPLDNWDSATKEIMKASHTEGWTRHDLRRTGATMLGEMGELPDIIEAALNHVSIRSTLAATYNQARYRPQVAEALQRLADALDGIEAGGAEIVPLRKA